MAYQGNAYDFADVMTELASQGVQVSLCSIEAPDGNLGPSGAPSGNYVSVAGLQNIVCMDAPDSFGSSLSASEQRALPEVELKSLRHVLLNAYYPQFSPETNWGNVGWRATLENTNTGESQTYDLRGAEADSQGIMTRLCLQVITV